MIPILYAALNATGIRIIGGALSFLLVLVITRRFGAVESAPYFFMLAVNSFLTAFVSLGQHVFAVKISAVLKSQVRQTRYTIYLIIFTLLMTTVCSIIIFSLAAIIQYTLLTTVVLYIPFMIFSQTTIILTSSILQGQRQTNKAALTQFVISPVILISYLLIFEDSTFIEFLTYTTISHILVAIGLWNRLITLEHITFLFILKRSYLKIIFLSGIAFLVPNLLGQINTLAIFLFLGDQSEAEITTYGVCTRITVIIGMVYFGISRVILPDFAKYFASNNFIKIKELHRNIIGYISPILLLTLCGSYYLSPTILSAFGPEFAVGSLSLQVMLLGQCFSVLNLINTSVLQMCDLGKKLTIAACISTFMTLIAAFPLVKFYGLFGAAIAYTINYSSLLLFSTAMTTQLYRKHKI